MNEEKYTRTFYVDYVIATATVLMVVSVAGSVFLASNQVIASIDNTIEEEERVAVGGGNITVSLNQFLPASVEIQRGESVAFYAPENSTEVHNVIFDLSNGSITSSLELPFILPEGSDSDQLKLAPPFNFGDPIIIEQPDGGEAIITLNKAAFYPTVVDRGNNTRYLLDVEELQQVTGEATPQGSFEPLNLSTNYTMNGTEIIVSSGIILDVSGFQNLEEEGEEEVSAANITTITPTNATNSDAAGVAEEGGDVEFAPILYPVLDSFTVTFEEPGTYEYFCAFHSGMWGIVTVAEEEEVAGEEEEVSAANITTITPTNATNSDATAVITTPIPPTETRPENITTTTEGGEDEEEE